MATIAQNLAALQQARTDIAEAIENKGVTLEEGAGFTDFPQVIEDIPTGVDTSNDTVTAATLKSGYTAHNAAGQKITGTLLSQSTTVTASTLKSGYTAYNKAGTRITGTLLSQNTTATKSSIESGKTAYDNNGNLITGTARIKSLELGLRVDVRNKTFTRLGDAVGLSGGTDFDNFPMYKRRRCNLADNGTVNAYLGDENYAVNGSKGQVMVEQPKFYYKVVPITVDNGKLLIAEYWISDQLLEGYKLHPAFLDTNGKEIDYYYESAYEGYIDNSKLCSISGVQPAKATRDNWRTYAANRGTGWRQETIWSLSADQLLMVIEYGHFNMQGAIGYGYTYGTSGYSGVYLSTGTLDTYGNSTYGVTNNNTTAVQWRGKENPWGNRQTVIDGVNIYGYDVYIANSYNFHGSTTSGYVYMTELPAQGNFISAFSYNSKFEWAFIPKEANSSYANSSVPVGDYYESAYSQSYSSYYHFLYGGDSYANYYNRGGLFGLECTIETSSYGLGSRLLYVG